MFVKCISQQLVERITKSRIHSVSFTVTNRVQFDRRRCCWSAALFGTLLSSSASSRCVITNATRVDIPPRVLSSYSARERRLRDTYSVDLFVCLRVRRIIRKVFPVCIHSHWDDWMMMRRRIKYFQNIGDAD